jgi:hypothetical protein
VLAYQEPEQEKLRQHATLLDVKVRDQIKKKM